MDITQSFQMYEDIVKHRRFYENFGTAHANYTNTLRAFDKLLLELDDTLTYAKMRMLAKSRLMTDNLLLKDLDMRREFVTLNKLHDEDVQNLIGTITANVAQNIPVLELFPGTGQFLPYAVAAEPLYIADRYIEICNEAGNILQNEFYENRRLLKYVVNGFDVSHLPQESFGLIYCFNEFFYCDEWYTHSWAKEVYKLLYNGGKFVFNFIPHDEAWAIRYNINLDFGVIDYKNLISELVKLGFELENYKIQQARSSYIVVKKPGDTASRVKLSGSVAEIIDI
jgi:SAM-dependent methyltransferase